MPSSKDGDVNEEMQMKVSVTRVGKWGERVVKHWPKEKDLSTWCWALWQIPRQFDIGHCRDSRTSTEFPLWGNTYDSGVSWKTGG